MNTFFIGAIVGLLTGICICISLAVYYFEIIHKPDDWTSYDYKGMAYEAARRHHIEVPLLFAIIQQESAWNPDAVSPKGAIGLMQIMPTTAQSFCGLTKQQLFDPLSNLECGTAYFAKQMKNFGSVRLALCAYNAGPTRVRKLGRCPSFKETTRYTRNVLKIWKGGKL